jgi:hypothetical protein
MTGPPSLGDRRAGPPRTAIIKRPVLVAVSAPWLRQRAELPPASTICLTMANRSKIERASRSIRVTVTTSPGVRAFSSFNSSRRSGRAPLTFSRKISDHPSARPPAGVPAIPGLRVVRLVCSSSSCRPLPLNVLGCHGISATGVRINPAAEPHRVGITSRRCGGSPSISTGGLLARGRRALRRIASPISQASQ